MEYVNNAYEMIQVLLENNKNLCFQIDDDLYHISYDKDDHDLVIIGSTTNAWFIAIAYYLYERDLTVDQNLEAVYDTLIESL